MEKERLKNDNHQLKGALDTRENDKQQLTSQLAGSEQYDTDFESKVKPKLEEVTILKQNNDDISSELKEN